MYLWIVSLHTHIYIVIHSVSRHLCNAPGPKQGATDMKLRRRQGLAERLLNPLRPGKRRYVDVVININGYMNIITGYMIWPLSLGI